MMLTAITAEGKNKWLKAQYYLLASSIGVASAILKLSLIILPFGAYSTTQSAFGGVRQQRSCVLHPDCGFVYSATDLGGGATKMHLLSVVLRYKRLMRKRNLAF